MAIRVPIATTGGTPQQGLPNINISAQGGRTAADFLDANKMAAIDLAKDAVKSAEKIALGLHAEEVKKNNAMLVKDASNQMDIYDQDAAYGNDNTPGWLDQTGKAVLRQDNGRPLMDNVLEDRQTKIGEILQGLGNEEQRQAFQEYADKSGVRVQGYLKRHQFEQNRNYQQGVLTEAIDTKTRNIALHYNDEAIIDDGISGIMEDSKALSRLQNGSEEAGQVSGRKRISEALKQSTLSALQHGEHTPAMRIQERFGEQLDPDDRIGIQDRIAEHWAAGMLESNPAEITALLGTDRLKAAILQQESGGKDFDASGGPLVSSDGKSMFAMQVTHATAAAPGFGITPARERSAAEYNRVGAELFDKLRERYNDDPAKVAAAYNAGAGAVDAAIEKGGADWLQHIPATTRDVYVPNVLRNLKTGTPADMMNEQDRRKWLNAARSQIEHGRNIYAVELKRAVNDQYSQATHTGQPGALVPASDFQRAFGEQWEPAYREYRDNMAFAGAYFSVKTLPTAQAAQLLADSKPQAGTPNFEHEQKQYDLLAKAIEAADKARQADPVEWAIQNGYNANPINWANGRDAQQELLQRAALAGQLAEQYDTPYTVLTKEEASQLTQRLSDGTDEDQLKTLKTLADGINDPQGYALTLQQIRPDSPATTLAGSLIGMDRIQKTSGLFSDSVTAIRGEDVARTILKGEALLNPSKATRQQDGKSTGVTMPSKLNESIYGLLGDALAGDLDTEQGVVSAVRAYYAAKMDKAKSEGGFVNENLLNEAVQSVTGGIAEHADKKVIMPFGMDETEFLDQAEAKLRQQLGDKAALVPFGKMPLIPVGANRYALQNGTSMLSVGGQPVILEFNP
ncbi:transglycosylase SLT domain-containing protein [Methylomonas sp. SURF-2]|uniref:Transglycosylase SLT domain-containing protein n=1 Tax=Methylomonas subterranea TaxID=2952225 RepID=A0ABT1TDK8_9GAMM|nr:transglycosylase SLT domain-containing protein [Methylomonas sp. SURF-2]MCQ8103536.1 transglycosylase SLT domain-containing protein [Methylomonas sp. SURF-2]